VKRIREKALKLYPLLEKWGTEDFGWPDLMFTESQAMIGAVSELMSLGIPSLSVHDSLIVPASKQEIAEIGFLSRLRVGNGARPFHRQYDKRLSSSGLLLRHRAFGVEEGARREHGRSRRPACILVSTRNSAS
jgi:hypothetical protein